MLYVIFFHVEILLIIIVQSRGISYFHYEYPTQERNNVQISLKIPPDPPIFFTSSCNEIHEIIFALNEVDAHLYRAGLRY